MVTFNRKSMTTAVLLMAGLTASASAQFVERPKLMYERDTEGFGFAEGESRIVVQPGKKMQLLENATLDLNGALAKANITALSYYANIGNYQLPFYIFTSFPVLTPDRDQLEEYLSNEILNPNGGLVNLTLARSWYYMQSPEKAPGEDALTVQFMGGGKLLEVVGLTENEYTPAMHLGGNAQLRMSLTETTNGSMAGLLQLRATVLANYVNSGSYNEFFTVEEDAPSRVPVTFSISGSIHIFDQLYISAGYVRAAEDRLPERKFVSMSVSRR